MTISPILHTAAAITLTIPDNEARTGLMTLQRRNVQIHDLQRAELLLFATAFADEAVRTAVRSKETLFNENMHELEIRSIQAPEPGEVWIADDRPTFISVAELGNAVLLRSWRIFDADGKPANEALLSDAVGLLLCNPAVQRRITHTDELSILKDTITR